MSRDKSLDILKGIGCLVMIVAHSSLNIGGYDRFKFWGGLAPVLFYSAAGVTAAMQAQKYKPRGVVFTYLFLIFLGYSFNRMTDSGFLTEIEFDIIQMIAVGSMAIYLIEYYFHPREWTYFALGLLAFAMKFALQTLFAGTSIRFINLLIPPGIFPIFPWLFLFFFGVFAYRVKNQINLALALLFTLTFFALQKINFPLDYENKWDMSLGYFLACSILLFSSFFILRAMPFLQQFKNGLLNFLGQNSLLFLFVHFPIILYLKEIRIHRTVKLIFQHPFLFWILVLGLTLLAMFLLLQITRVSFLPPIFDNLAVWILIAALVFASGWWIHSERAVYFIEIGLGICTALFYSRLSALLKQRVK